MHRFITRLFAFTLSASIVYLVVFGILYMVRANNVPLVFRATQGQVFEGGITYKKFRDFNPTEKYDVIVLGSSHAYRGYDPEIFNQYGLSMYNLGSSNQSIMASYFIASNYINRHNCKTVILDVYDRVFKQESIEPLSDIIQNITSEKVARQIAFASKDIRAVNMLTLRFYNKFSVPLNIDTLGIDRGFIPYTTQLSLPDRPKELEYATNKKSLRFFKKLIAYLHQQGIKVIITEHPLPLVYSITKENHELFKADIIPIMSTYKVPFYDYLYDSSMTGIQYFSDENHLSLRGIKKYNNKLLSDLVKDKAFAKQ